MVRVKRLADDFALVLIIVWMVGFPIVFLIKGTS